MTDYKELLVWQKSVDLAILVFDLIKHFPKYESNALAEQMRRSAISIPSNIAEGYARYSDKELLKFLYISRGSRAELETQLIIAEKLSFISKEQSKQALTLCEEIGKMLNSFIAKINQKNL